MLTVLVPIKDSDATVVTSLPAVTPDNINVIYKHEGVYKRIWLNPVTNQYEYHEVVDREFPYLGKPLEIFDFTYDATRMGHAPTITAQGVMWFADKDENKNDVTLEDLWLARNNDCHVSFNGENFYLKQVPTCSKGNEDARYKYDIDFVSERVVLEQVYLYDVVQPFITEKPISESSEFSFFGDVNELAKRINASLLRSGLSYLEMREGVSKEDILTYEEWNEIGLGTYAGDKPIRKYVGGQGVSPYRYFYPYYGGDYNAYLRGEIYAASDGEFVLRGYVCKIGKDKKGAATTSDEKLITFENNTIHEALQEIHDTFELQYYITSEKDDSGNLTGNTIIMVADCEHDFADVTGTDQDGNPIYLRDADGIPTSLHPLEYGVDGALLSKEKTNTTDKIITRITGTGSEENIPWHYPNPTPDGWLKPIYKRNGELIEIEIDYPKSEEDMVRYERYLKNRIGNVFQYGVVKDIWNGSGGKNMFNVEGDERTKLVQVYYDIDAREMSSPVFTLELDISNGSNCDKLEAELSVAPSHDGVTYDSSKTYDDPNDFQRAFIEAKGRVAVELESGKYYFLTLKFTVSDLPKSRTYKKAGYYYEGERLESPTGPPVWVPDGFYGMDGLIPYVTRLNKEVLDYGYTLQTGLHEFQDQVPYPQVIDIQYYDIKTDTIYKCIREPNEWYGIRTIGYEADPQMSADEWFSTFVSLRVRVIDADVWALLNKKVELSDFGISIGAGTTYTIYDTIEFRRLKYITPQPRLMPELYIKTDGERRFYNAVKYPLDSGTPDAMAGEDEIDGKIVNPIYYKGDTTTHYDFENEYIQHLPHEHIERFDDVKPSINGQVNTVEGVSLRIDVVEEFAYDVFDNDELWVDTDEDSASGEYKHPYFFAKLRPLGFNLFDLALQDDMVLSMTTGHCGACNFKIAVDENTKKNPVQIWEYDVYEKIGEDLYSSEPLYLAKSLRRYVDYRNLFYKIGDDYIHVSKETENTVGFLVPEKYQTNKYKVADFSSGDVLDGAVGSTKSKSKVVFEGDVVTRGSFIDCQQDTSEDYVWIALTKDTDTYGVLMPSARPDYGDGNYSVYIRPKSISDVHTQTSTDKEDEENADKFVLTNIRLPQVYLRRAEKELSKRLVAYMYDNNYQKFNFDVGFSRIFLAQNEKHDSLMNENSVLYVSFNNRTYRQYVKSYSYKMSNGIVLPEITVSMNEELSVSRTLTEEGKRQNKKTNSRNMHIFRRLISMAKYEIDKKYVGIDSDVVLSGSVVSRSAGASLAELSNVGRSNADAISEVSIDVSANHFKKTDFEILNGTDLKIGNSVFLPTAYKDGDAIKRRVWDESQQAFVDDSSNTFSVEKTGAYSNIVKAFDQIDRANRCATVTIDGTSYKVQYSLPPTRVNPEQDVPEQYMEGGRLWFRRYTDTTL